MSSHRVQVKFDWLDYLSLAKQLIDDSEKSDLKDAMLRSAVSRAYFTVFCLARNYLRDEEEKLIPSKDSHKWLIKQFQGNRTKAKISTQLVRLRDDRNKADYSDSVKNLGKLAESVIIGVINTLENLDKLY